MHSMNLKNEPITESTHPLLIQMIHAYQDTPIPSRQELLEVQYEMPQVDGHLRLRDLCQQIGVEYIKEDEE